MTIRRLFIGLTVFLILAVGGYWTWQTQLGPGAQATPTPRALFEAVKTNRVTAEGIVVPARRAQLGFTLSGRLEAWLVDEGGSVSAGTVLARIFAPEVAQSVAQAEAGLAVAEATLAQAVVGTRSEDIAAAEAGVENAVAQVEAAQAQVQQAEASLAEAQAALAEAERKPTEEEIRIAEARLEQARAGVRQAQAAYDLVAHRADVAALPQSEALEEATLAVEIAEAEFEQVTSGVSAERLDQLRAAVQQAAAAVEQARAQAKAAGAARDQARAALEKARNGPTDEEIAVLEARVQQAKAGLERARQMAAQTTLVAPFEGTLAHQLVEAGEPVAPGQPAATFGQLDTLQVETDDLSEIDIAEVRQGQSAEVRFDALPDVVAHGRVTAVRSVAETQRGETTYTVIIALDSVPADVRWGMTAVVDIFTK